MECFICFKSYATRQGLERHILKANTKCFSGDLSAVVGFREYCSLNSRSYCGNCNKLCAQREVCPQCSGDMRGVEHVGVLDVYQMQNDAEDRDVGGDRVEGEGSDIDPVIALHRILMMNTVCLKSIPQHAIRPVADAYNRLLKTVIGAPYFVDNHARLLLFVPFVLALKVKRKVKQ
jgi:hypothetical protein